ncbi:MAG: hypothetical protein K2L12_07805 [Clostridia bacterium]|nr:hypothetical protein [Clostridia bacterium]
MAEERLIDTDDDKDKKYKIRINEDGEEELYIEVGDDEDEEPVFDMPLYDDDDEEAAILTPEQLAERERIRQEEELARIGRRDNMLEKTRTALEKGDFEDALYAVNNAIENDGECGEAHYLKMRILTRDLTTFNNPEECTECAENVSKYCDESQKAGLKELSSGLESKLKEAEKRTEELKQVNEAGKDERRNTFAVAKTHALIGLILTVCPFAVFLITTIVFSTMMFADENGAYLIATIVLGALALIAFICALVGANKYWTAVRNVKLNESDTSTQAGRDYLESKKYSELLNTIYSSFAK